jgi:hypothetical protein
LAAARIWRDNTRPTPYKYVKAISIRLLRGRSTPEIRAIYVDPFIVVISLSVYLKSDCEVRLTLSLPLFVTGVLADHTQDSAAADDLALLANLLNGRSDLHICLQNSQNSQNSNNDSEPRSRLDWL